MGANHRGRVLVVDDEVELMRALCDGLENAGYEVTGDADPIAVLDRLRPGSFHVVIVDLMMPRLDGIQFLRRALLIDSELVGILMTGEASQQTVNEAKRAGAFDYVPKPFKLSSLRPVLDQAFEARGLIDSI